MHFSDMVIILLGVVAGKAALLADMKLATSLFVAVTQLYSV